MTYFRSDGWVKSVIGQAVAGAQVYVCSQPADVSYVPPIPQVSLFSDTAGTTPLANPVITDGFGHYDFYVPYGTYTVVIVNSGKIQQVYTDQTVGFTASTPIPPPVTSVFSRVGDVAAQAGDYSAFYDTLGAAAAAVVGLAPLSSPSFSGTIQIVNASITGTLKDGTGVVGTPGQLLSSTGTGTLWTTPAGAGTVTHTGNLTLNALVVGNATADIKVLASLGTTTTVLHGNAAGLPTFGAVVEADITLANNVTNNVSNSAHGFAPILPNDATKFLDGTGAYSVPASSGPTLNIQVVSYTAVLGDANNIVEMNVAGANNFTVPTNASVAFAIGATLTVIQFGAGQTTLLAAGGVTIQTPSSLTARVQYSTVCVIKVATDTWIAAGDLT